MDKILTNCRIFTGDQILNDHSLVISGGTIIDIISSDPFNKNCEVIDLDHQLLAPGFIDTQVNGGANTLFNHATTVTGIANIGRAHRAFGTTGFLPTLISDCPEKTAKAIEATRAAIVQKIPGVLGIHLEGPHLNKLRKGVHPEEKLSPTDQQSLTLLSQLEHIGCSVVTVAPEIASTAFISQLASKGIRVCAGHSAASYQETKNALEHGLSGFTHLLNAMPSMQNREPGIVGAALEDKHSYCGIIVDGHHVHPATLKVIIRAKARGKMMLVTDAVHSVGALGDQFDLMGRTIYRHAGKVTTIEGVLAGSDLDMASAVRNCVKLLDLPVEEALRMASLYPASFLGLEEQYGKIAIGYKANLVLLNDKLEATQTWIDGCND